MCAINDWNRESVQSRYVDSTIANLDFMQIRSLLREYLHSEKNHYSLQELEDEIKARGLWWEAFEPLRYRNEEFDVSLLEEEAYHA